MKYFLITVVIVILSGGYYWWSTQKETPQTDTTTINNTEDTVPTKTETNTQPTPKLDHQIYENTAWGIKFEYPNDWEIRQPAFGSKVSLFNLAIESKLEKKLPDPIIINITPKYWVDNIIKSTPQTEFTNYTIDGKKAIYYSSTDMGIPTWSYFTLINNTYWINISGKKEYEEILNQVLSSLTITPIDIPTEN